MLLNWQINKLAILEKLHQSGYCLDLTKDWLVRHYTYLNNISNKENMSNNNTIGIVHKDGKIEYKEIDPSDIENHRIIREARENHELMMNPKLSNVARSLNEFENIVSEINTESDLSSFDKLGVNLTEQLE